MGLMDLFRKRDRNIPPELLGTWKMVRSELPQEDDVRMIFHADGRLDYEIHLPEKTQIMKLTYPISGDAIISNQPSNPREERTRFAFEDSGKTLVLEHEGSKSWLNKLNPR